MTPHARLCIGMVLALCFSTTIAGDEPRLTPAEVSRAADSAARQQGYDLKTYTRGEASYDPASKTWGVNYRLNSSKPRSASNGVLSVEISDTTGFASTRFWLTSPTPSPPANKPLSTEVVFSSLYVAGGMLLAFVPFDRSHTRSRWARATFVLTALVLIFVGVSELLRYFGIWTLSQQREHGFSHTLAVLHGVVLGFLLVLVFSGELAGRKLVAHKTTKQALESDREPLG